TTRIDQHGDAAVVHFSDDTSYEADFVILGTGFTIDPLARKEFGQTAGEILLWQDVYTPPRGEESGDLGRFPYLNSDFSFREKQPGRAPWLSNVYCFNYGASASLGKVSGDIPGISDGAAWLARALAATLYAEDIEAHWQGMQDYDAPELIGDEWEPTELEEKVKNREGQVA
ncbi:MAG: FAD-dependent oxidoreductase, partial [Roseibium sp.]